MTVTGKFYFNGKCDETIQEPFPFVLPKGDGKCYKVETSNGTEGYVSYNCKKEQFRISFGNDKSSCEQEKPRIGIGLNKCSSWDPGESSYMITGCTSDGLSDGAVAGIVVGSIVGLILIYYLYKKFGSNSMSTNPLPSQNAKRPG